MICIKPRTTTPPPRAIAARPRRHGIQAALAAAALLLASLPAVAQTGPQPRLKTVPLSIGMHRIQAELAVTPEQQSTGMMFRREMGVSEGMLFVNDHASVRCFWMRNTLIPLSIAFIDEGGRIVNIADMAPHDERQHCSTAPVHFALEMRQGWFASRGIKPGAQVRGAPVSP